MDFGRMILIRYDCVPIFSVLCIEGQSIFLCHELMFEKRLCVRLLLPVAYESIGFVLFCS